MSQTPSPAAPDARPATAGSLKQFLGCVVALIAIPTIFLLLLALILPNRWESEQVITVVASPDAVHAFLDDASSWEQWFRPGRGGEQIPITYSLEGPPRGAGAKIRWTSDEASIGDGTITITESTPGRIAYAVSMEEKAVTAEGTIELVQVDAGTLITWRDSGTIPRIPGGLVAWLVERAVDQVHAENLAELKRIFARRARDAGDGG